MELTKEQALKWSLSLWEWLATTGSTSKADWPGWEEWNKTFHLDKESNCAGECPLCEYATRTSFVSESWSDELARCKVCPVPRWGRYRRCTTISGWGLFDKWFDLCFNKWSTPYLSSYATLKERKKAAQRIVNVIKTTKEKLEKEQAGERTN